MDPTSKAKLLRRTQTEAEKSLWFRLRDRRLEGYKFRCQVAIGPYIADFVCMSARLIIEIDGGQHADQAAHDRKRERYLRNEGYEIVRYWNNEVLGNLEGVLTTLTLTLSLRERERRSSRLPEEDGSAGIGVAEKSVLPLPQGEGRGEGGVSQGDDRHGWREVRLQGWRR